MSRSLLLASVPILALGAVTILSLLALAGNAQSRIESTRLQLTTETAGQGRGQQAGSVLRGTDLFVAERLNDIIDWTRADPVMSAANLRRADAEDMADWPTDLVESQNPAGTVLDESETSSQFLRNQIIGQPLYDQVLLTDSNGFTVGATEAPERFAHRDEAWWQQAWLNGAFVGPITVDEDGARLTFEMALRIDLPATGNSVGVMRAVVDATVLQEYAADMADEGAGVDVQLITTDGIILADTASDNDPSVIGSPVTLDEAVRAAFDQLDTGETENGFVVVDEAVVGFARSDPTIPASQVAFEVPSPRWIAVARQPMSMALAPLADVDQIGEDLDSSVRNQSLLVLALVLLTIVLAWFGARRLADSIAQPINQLRFEAIRVADHELPTMVSSIAAGYDLDDIPGPEPIEVEADGEVADLAFAFNTLQATATDLAASQALGRNRDVASVLLNLGRRNQQLIGRQLRYIDQLERDESDPDTLRSLFLLDQMATRMRRNAESLLVLAGEDPPRRGTQPRPPEEILRAAISEVEDYARVTITTAETARIRPHVVSDLTHLLAELIENATNFSAPETTILVSGEREPSGAYTISVIDRGIGMSPDRLAQANARISDPSFTSDASTSFLGLYVVGRLAARHHIAVRLVESGSAGVAAVITLPPSCLVEDPHQRPAAPPMSADPLVQNLGQGNGGQHSWPAPAAAAAEGTADPEHYSPFDPDLDRPAAPNPPVMPLGGEVSHPITAPTPAIRPPSLLPEGANGPDPAPVEADTGTATFDDGGSEPGHSLEPDMGMGIGFGHSLDAGTQRGDERSADDPAPAPVPESHSDLLPDVGHLPDSGRDLESNSLGTGHHRVEPGDENGFIPEPAADEAGSAEATRAAQDHPLLPPAGLDAGAVAPTGSPADLAPRGAPPPLAPDAPSAARSLERRDDDTDGLPIPPFRARQSRRPEPGVDEAAQPTPAQTFQVKRRVPGQALAQAGQPVGTDLPDRTVEIPRVASSPSDTSVSRATEVRDKLTRFSIGVGAARADTAAAASAHEPENEDGNEAGSAGALDEPPEGPRP